MLRSLPAFMLVLAINACQPSLPHTSPQGSVVTAVFDPLSAKIPLPNDLALPPFNAPNTVCPPPANTVPGAPICAQAELLVSFNGQFPSDQEVAITIDFAQANIDASGRTTQVAPDLDLTSFTPSTFFVYASSPPYQGEVPIDALKSGDYVKFADHGTLTLHHQGHAPWPSGSYAVFVRGGTSGVKTIDGLPVHASQVFDLVAQGLDMTDRKNLGLLKAQAGSMAAAIEQGRQLNLLIALYQSAAYPIVDTRFPHQELAILTTFTIAPAVTNVTIDPARGLAPLPIDLLRDPRDPKENPAGGKLTLLAACTLAGSSLAADGTCPSPAAAGFSALDGFSTTGAILAPTSELIRAATVTKDSLRLYDLSDPAHPAQVKADDLILEPCEFTSACGSATALSPVVAIQPAGATAVDPQGSLPSVFRTKPLKDNTDYAVVLTTGILDKAGKPIGPGTVANILRFSNPVIVGGHSALLGIDDATAAGLEKMRLQLVPVFGTLAATGTDRSKVAIAYTFHTQTILKQANQLAALPYSPGIPAETALPTLVAVKTPTEAFTKYGVDPTIVPGSGASGNIDEILEADIVTFNALDPATGAFLADPSRAMQETIHVLIATPLPTNPKVGTCTGLGKCAPLMVFRHGLGGGRADMLTVADSFAAAGMVTVAIDAAKHGDRSFCTSGATGTASGCVSGTCTMTLPAGAQGDAHPPGTCDAAGFIKRPVSPNATGNTDGIPVVSSNYLVSANFFRTRDTLRQDLIDESQLVHVLAFVPTADAPPPTTKSSVFNHMFARGVVIDPATIYFSGQSLGAIQGTMDVATNPRISKAVFNVAGGSIVDIFTNSPAFAAGTNQLLAGLGIQRGTAAFLQFLVVAKTVLDPADPINFAGHLTANTLPNLLAGGTPQVAKKVLAQVANCDAVVPNPFSFVHASNIPTGPLPFDPSFGTGTGTFQLFIPTDPGTAGDLKVCSSTTAVEHGFLTDWVKPPLTKQAQADLAAFVTQDISPPSLQHP